jgi:hypothetical protein
MFLSPGHATGGVGGRGSGGGMDIKVFNAQIPKEELLALAKSGYGDMVKGVIDIHNRLLALGGELHADCEQILLDQGSKQADLWGFNIYPEKNREEYLEYTSLINIRPRQGNMDREIKDLNLRLQIKNIIDKMVTL